MSAENASRGGKPAPAGWKPVRREFDYAYQKPDVRKLSTSDVRKSASSAAEIVRKVVKNPGK